MALLKFATGCTVLVMIFSASASAEWTAQHAVRAANLTSTLVRLAQAGSTGGTIGKTRKSISGGEDASDSRESDAGNQHKRATSSKCHLVGSWAWSTGGTAVIKSGGTLSKGKLTAAWTCKDNKVVLKWSHGYIDHLTLTPDAKSLNGTNNRGYNIHASRKEAE